MVYIRPATREDAEWVHANLRPEDAREVATVRGDVLRSFEMSDDCYAIFSTAKVQPIGLLGVVDSMGGYGAVWFVATNGLRGNQFSLLRESKRWLDHLSKRFPNGLHNYADTRNSLHIRWCQLTGFTLGDIEEQDGVPFQYIHRLPGASHLV